jgi:hypothetical protein
MSVAGISFAAGAHAASHQAAPATGARPQNGRQLPSMTDIDAQGSSVTSAPTSTGKVGSKIDIVA